MQFRGMPAHTAAEALVCAVTTGAPTVRLRIAPLASAPSRVVIPAVPGHGILGIALTVDMGSVWRHEVQRVVPNSLAAAEPGIAPGVCITAVNGRPTSAATTPEMLRMISSAMTSGLVAFDLERRVPRRSCTLPAPHTACAGRTAPWRASALPKRATPCGAPYATCGAAAAAPPALGAHPLPPQADAGGLVWSCSMCKMAMCNVRAAAAAIGGQLRLTGCGRTAIAA